MYWHSSPDGQFDKQSAIHIALELEALPFEASQLELVLEDSHNPNFKLYIFKDDLKKKKKKKLHIECWTFKLLCWAFLQC